MQRISDNPWFFRASELAGYVTLLLAALAFSDFPYAPRWYWCFLPSALFLFAATFVPLAKLLYAYARYFLHWHWRSATCIGLSYASLSISWAGYLLNPTPHPYLFAFQLITTLGVLAFTILYVLRYRASRRPSAR